MSLGGLDEQELSSPLLLAVVINNKTSFSKDLFFFFLALQQLGTYMCPYTGVRSLNHWAAREVPPRVLLIVFLVGSFKQLVFVSLLFIS